MDLPTLPQSQTAVKLDNFTGEIGSKCRCDFSDPDLTVNGNQLTLSQRQSLMAKYLVSIQGTSVFVNTMKLVEDHSAPSPAPEKEVDED